MFQLSVLVFSVNVNNINKGSLMRNEPEVRAYSSLIVAYELKNGIHLEIAQRVELAYDGPSISILDHLRTHPCASFSLNDSFSG